MSKALSGHLSIGKRDMICLVFVGLFVVVASAPTETRPWTHPCGAQRSVISVPILFNIKVDPTPDSELAQKVSIGLAELSDLLEDQSNTYISLDPSIVPNESLYLPLDGLPTPPGPKDISKIPQDDLPSYAKETYEDLSKIWVYIEQAKIDAEVNKHINMSQAVTNYDKIIKALKNVMCQLSEILGADFDNIQHVERDVMPEYLRDVRGTANQLDRDFMLLRHVKQLVDPMRINYQILKGHS